MKKKFTLITAVFTAVILLSSVGNSQPAQAALQGDNGKIVFASNRDGNYEIYVMNADGSSQTRLTSNSANEGSPHWSPDGSKIVFNTDRDGNGEIYSMNGDGSAQTRLTSNAANDNTPTYSSNGTRLAFITDRDGNNEVYTMNADGSSQANVTNSSTPEYSPSWSPDGNKIAFSTNRDGNYEIYTINPDGSIPTRLTNNAATDDAANWSPDSTRLAFYSVRDGNNEIYSMNADGSAQTRLTNNAALESNPAWSPDGTKIAFWTNRDAGNNEVYVMNPDGTAQTRITNNAASDYVPDWQPLIGTTTSDGDGRTTTTVASSQNYPVADYTVESNETLVLNGRLCDVTVQSGGVLKGTGTACTITVESGGTVNPGNSPGCLASGNLSLSGTYTAEIAGTTACSGYDQLQVTGTVTVGGSLNVSLLNGFNPTAGNVFTLITNDGSDPVTGIFTGLTESATVTIGSSIFKISYVGGTGNDVTLTAQAATALPGLPKTGNLPASLVSLPLLLAITGGVITVGSTWAIRRRFNQR